MDVYWNGIATPLFIFTLVMGLMTLFNMAPINRVEADKVAAAARTATIALKT